MRKIRIKFVIILCLGLGLLATLLVPVKALDISIQFGTPPPRMPRTRFHAAPEPVYVDYYRDAVLNLGSGYFSLDYPVVYGYSRDYDLTPEEVLYILYLSHYSHHSPTYVIRIYREYHRRGWTVMSRHLTLDRNYPRWMRNQDAPSISVLYATSSYYDVPYTQVQRIYTRGYRPAEIVVAINVANRSGKPVSGILSERNRGRKWEDITKEHKMSLGDIKAPARKGRSVKFGAPLVEKESPPPVIKGKKIQTGHENMPNMPNKSNLRDNRQKNEKDRGWK